jgi:tRNA(Ile)-lysidine synthase
MLEDVQRFIVHHGLALSGQKVLAAVSGGPDSMCLLDVLWNLSKVLGFGLHVSYVDHQTRPGTRLEAQHVSEQADRRQISFSALTADVRSRVHGGGPEQAARVLRYDLLTHEARRIDAVRIALGHTRDDQAETVIIRLMRGTGLAGLGGMRPIRDGLFVRPLLEQSRERVHEYLDRGSIPFLVDPTNDDPMFLRNRVRSEILPRLARIEPRIVRKLCGVADHARAGWDMLDPLVQLSIESTGHRTSAGWLLDGASFRELEPPMHPLVIRGIVGRVLGDTRGLYASHVRAVSRLASSSHGSASVDLHRGLSVTRAYDEIVFSVVHPVRGSFPCVAVNGPGNYEFIGGQIRVDVRAGESTPPFPLSLRSREAGDRLAGRSRKLKRLLIDRKVPRHLRDSVPLIACGGEVFWVGGLYDTEDSGLDVSFSPDPGSRLDQWLSGRSGGDR